MISYKGLGMLVVPTPATGKAANGTKWRAPSATIIIASFPTVRPREQVPRGSEPQQLRDFRVGFRNPDCPLLAGFTVDILIAHIQEIVKVAGGCFDLITFS